MVANQHPASSIEHPASRITIMIESGLETRIDARLDGRWIQGLAIQTLQAIQHPASSIQHPASSIQELIIQAIRV